MRLVYPLELVSSSSRRTLMWISGISALMVGISLAFLGRMLTTPAAPLGSVSLELAGQGFIANSILGSWGMRGQLIAAFALGLDFLFLASYSTLLSVACVEAARKSGNIILSGACKTFAWSLLIVALAAICENVLLFRVLSAGDLRWVPLIRLCAEIKYSLVIAAFCCIVAGWQISFLRRSVAKPNRAVRPYSA